MESSAILRDFLRIREDGNGDYSGRGRANSLAGLTLDDILRGPKSPSGRVRHERTLLDIIRDDPNSAAQPKNGWRLFREKIRLKRAGTAWNPSFAPASDVPISTNSRRVMAIRRDTGGGSVVNSVANSESARPGMVTRQQSGSVSLRNSIESTQRDSSELAQSRRHNSTRVPDSRVNELFPLEPRDRNDDVTESIRSPDQQVRMSLMALLAETDREMGIDVSSYIYAAEDDDDDESLTGDCGSGPGPNKCCVCMVRHKGSAFIPCGHTFCRLCSRELWVQRGNCPLCNNFISEILDIF